MKKFLGFSKKIIVFMLVAIVAMTCLPNAYERVYAADPIASLNGVYYYEFVSLRYALYNNSSNSMTIEMLRDWDAADSSAFDDVLAVPQGKTLTLNMNGHMFNRRRTSDDDWCNNGLLIYVKEGATLTINGGDDSKAHEVYVHNSTSDDEYAVKYLTTFGGTLAGGSSSNTGGGIHMESNCTVTLNNVIIAGCRAEQTWGSGGYGGGVHIAGEKSKLKLNNSLIVGCYAYNDGGAIYEENSNVSGIELNNSTIESNFAHRYGGGVAIDGEHCYIMGDDTSKIINNVASDAGGGIYIWNDDISVSNLLVKGNKVEDYSGEGGGVYVKETKVKLCNLEISQNEAGKGDGVFINNDKNTISNCVITGQGNGEGVYVEDGVDDGFEIVGSTIIKDNQKNLFMAGDDAEDCRVNFSLTKGAEVHVSYDDQYQGGEESILVTSGSMGDTIKSPNCIRYLYSDQAGFYFDFVEAPDARKIIRKAGDKPGIVNPTAVTSANANDASNSVGDGNTKAGVVGTVGPGGEAGSDYNLIRGFFTHQSIEGDEDTNVAFYYSDGFFDEDPTVYNPHLATFSLDLVSAAMYLTKKEEAIDGNTYYNKHAGGRQLLADIGVPDQNIYVNDSNVSKPGTDSIGVIIGSKMLKYSDGSETGKILIPIAVRGGGYELEWASNMTLGDSSYNLSVRGKELEHKGFSNAADQVCAEIDYYISKYNLQEEIENGNVCFFVCGFSRAGATANITAKRLVEKYSQYNDKIFAYPCEAPQGGTDAAELLPAESYYCIHNLINNVDVVPMVGPTLMGFKRYGVDHYLPGTDAGQVVKSVKTVNRGDETGSPITVSTYADNTALATKPEWQGAPDFYALQRTYMLNQLAMVDSEIVFDDYFHPMALDFVPEKVMYENGYYYSNKAEDFVADFVRFLQEGTGPSKLSDPSQAVSNRDMYDKDLQAAFREIISMIFTLPNNQISVMMGRARWIMDRMSKMELLDFYDDCVGDWSTLEPAKKQYYKDFLWKELEATEALDALGEDGKAVIEKNWDVLAEFIFRLVEADYNYYPGKNTSVSSWANGMDESMTMIPTFVTHSSYILSCHYPEISISWARSYDNYYNSETVEYKITPPTSLAAPAAYVNSASGEEALSTSSENELSGDQKIILENKDIVGEACYYDLYEGDTKIASNQIYRGGIDLTLAGEREKTYTITTYDMSYSVKSAPTTYVIKLSDNKHQVMVNDLDSSGEARSDVKTYKEGADVTLLAGECESKYFKNWTVESFAQGATSGVDVTDTLLGEEEQTKVGTIFELPALSTDFPEGYSLVATAQYGDRITAIDSEVEVGLNQIPTGNLLQYATIEFDNGARKSFPVYWSYIEKQHGNTVPARFGDVVYKDTEYIATVKLSPSRAEGIMFAEEVSVGDLINSSVGQITNLNDGKLVRNNADGSISLIIKYEATSDSEAYDQPGLNIRFGIVLWDLNLGEPVPGVTHPVYYVNSDNTYSFTAPTIENEVFVKWDLRDDNYDYTYNPNAIYNETIDIGIPAGTLFFEYTAFAQYMPVVTEIKADISSPQTGKLMPSDVELKVKITDEYIVHPDNISLSWSPTVPGDGKAEALQTYTVTIGLAPDASKIKVSKDGIHYTEITPMFVYSDNLSASVNGENAVCNLDSSDPKLTYTFPMTTYVLAMVKQPSDLTDIANGSDVASLLPNKIKVLTEGGMEIDCDANWNAIEQIYGEGDSRNAAGYKASGNVILPDYIDIPEGKSLDVEMYIEVNSADTASKPEASLETGTYYYVQTTTLSSAEDGDIYYTTDGSDPADAENAARKLYDGNEIEVNGKGLVPDAEGQKFFTLRAVTVKNGMWDSAEATYSYTLQLPPEEDTFTITFDLNGGNLDGKSGVIVMYYSGGTVINLPDAPTKEGYVFDYWQGSKYEAGAEYTVTGDHTFTAIYKEAAAADDDNPSDEGDSGVDTGDHSHIRGWLSTCVISIFVLSACIIIRRKDEIKLNHGEKDDF